MAATAVQLEETTEKMMSECIQIRGAARPERDTIKVHTEDSDV